MASSPSSSTEITFAQACDLCRRMKIKCERKGNQCAHCLSTGSECHFAPVEKKLPKVKRPEQLSSMEERIARMEAIISASGLEGQEARGGYGRWREPTPEDADDEELADKFSSLVVDGRGEAKYIGSASSFSLLSPRGIQWITQKVGSSDLENVMAETSRYDWATWREFRAELYQPLPDDEREPLPSLHTAVQYVEHFFDHFNNIHPLFNRSIFNAYLDRQYSSQPPDDMAWYAAFNVVLALGCMQQQMQNQRSSRVGFIINHHDPRLEQSWRYFRNASSLFVDLMFKQTNLLAAQAMLGMAFILQTLPDPQPSYTMVAAACRLSQRLGLHTSVSQKSIPPSELAELEQRRSVFWIAYTLDKVSCLRAGCPPTLHDEDIGVRLPDADSTASPISSSASSPTSTTTTFSLFRCRCELALIEGRVYSELYSARSRLRSQADRLASIAQLDKQLEGWKERIPEDIRPATNEPIDCDETIFDAALRLHAAYYECVQIIHRASPFHSSWFGEGEQPPSPPKGTHGLNTRIFSSSAICIKAARCSLELLRNYTSSLSHERVPKESLDWSTTHYPLSATLTLFANIIQNPDESTAADDIELMNLVSGFLGTYTKADKAESVAANRTIMIFQALAKTASTHVTRSRTKTLPKEKRTRANVPVSTLPPSSSQASRGNQNPRPIRKASSSATTSRSQSSRSTTQSPSQHPPQAQGFDTFVPLTSDSMIAQPITAGAPSHYMPSQHMDQVPMCIAPEMLMSNAPVLMPGDIPDFAGMQAMHTQQQQQHGLGLVAPQGAWDVNADMWGWYGGGGEVGGGMHGDEGVGGRMHGSEVGGGIHPSEIHNHDPSVEPTAYMEPGWWLEEHQRRESQ